MVGWVSSWLVRGVEDVRYQPVPMRPLSESFLLGLPPGLKVLELGGYELTPDLLRGLERFEELEELWLLASTLTLPAREALLDLRCPRLRELSLRISSGLEGADQVRFWERPLFQGVRRLNLNGSGLGVSALRALARSSLGPRLTRLSTPQLGHEEVEALAGFPTLNELRIELHFGSSEANTATLVRALPPNESWPQATRIEFSGQGSWPGLEEGLVRTWGEAFQERVVLNFLFRGAAVAVVRPGPIRRRHPVLPPPGA